MEKKRNRNDKVRSLKKKKRRGFHGLKKQEVAERNTFIQDTNTTQQQQPSTSKIELHKTTSKILDINRDISEHNSDINNGIRTRKRKGNTSLSTDPLDNTCDAITGYKVIHSSVIQDILNLVSICNNCRTEKKFKYFKITQKRKE